MAHLHIVDIEGAINFWRSQDRPDVEIGLSPQLNALSEVYAQMVFDKSYWVEEAILSKAALDAWLVWYASTPDTPCIAICSTSQGDAVCKGCGRQFEEIQHWPGMTPAQKRFVWHRITKEGLALRFTSYADRATCVPRKAPTTV